MDRRELGRDGLVVSAQGLGSMLPTVRELRIGFVVGRGFLTGQIRSLDDLDEDDWRRTNPRFQQEALEDNLKLADRVKDVAAERGVTPAQLALAWVMAKGDDIVPIPGTKRRRYLEENAAAADINLSADDVAQLDEAVPLGRSAAGATSRATRRS